MNYDTAPLQSKKFIAYLFANISTKLYLFYATGRGEGDIVLITTIICSLFLDVGYILGQASLDKYVRVAELMSESARKKAKEVKEKV